MEKLLEILLGNPVLLMLLFLAGISGVQGLFGWLQRAAAEQQRLVREQQQRRVRDLERDQLGGSQPATPPSPARPKPKPEPRDEIESFLKSLLEPASPPPRPKPAPPPPKKAPPRAKLIKATPAPKGDRVRLELDHLQGLESNVSDRSTVEGRTLTSLEGSLVLQPAQVDTQAKPERNPLLQLDRLPALQRAVAFAEVLGPPRAHAKHRRR